MGRGLVMAGSIDLRESEGRLRTVTTVLLVEDNPADAFLARDMLAGSTTPFQLAHVAHLSDALDYLVDHEIAVILLDLSLPDAHGLAALARFHAVAPRVPIVVMSGNDERRRGINAEAQRLSRLIDDMLDLDRMESGRLVRHREPVDLNALITEVAGDMRPSAPLHLLRLDLSEALPPLSGDRDKLRQVLTNLLSNAVKYSPEGGEITLSSRVEGTCVHVRVQDHGVGMPPEALEAVFERYARIDSDATRSIQGTGLGLPIVRRIVTLHGGAVWAKSAPGQGSVFHVTIPLAGTSAVA
jgi:signal transduction histidine kinase